MKLTREYVRPMPGSSIACLEFNMPEFDHGYHYHPELELTWIVESEGERLIGDCIKPFGPGDLVLIGANIPHKYHNWQRGRALSRVIQFRSDLFGNEFLNLPEFRCIEELIHDSCRGLEFSAAVKERALKKIESLFGAQSGAERLLKLLELLSLLATDANRKQLASPFYAKPVRTDKAARLQRVLNYLESNWQHPVQLQEVARVAALHPQSISRFFRQHLGVNFQEYLIQMRLARAARRLLRTDETVVDIAFQCGFNNLGNFNKHFRQQYGMPPSAYRKEVAGSVGKS